MADTLRRCVLGSKRGGRRWLAARLRGVLFAGWKVVLALRVADVTLGRAGIGGESALVSSGRGAFLATTGFAVLPFFTATTASASTP